MRTEPALKRGWCISRRLFLQASTGALAAASFAATVPLRFGVVTDVHYADRPPANNRYYRLGTSKLRACVDLMNSQEVEFLVELGDFKDQDIKPTEDGTLSFLRSIEKVFQAFPGPRYHVLGNHDMDSITKEQFLPAVVNSGIDPALTWFSFDRAGCHFVVLDANFRADMTPYSRGNFDWRDANIPPEQLQWLAKDLRQSSRPSIVFVHQRLDEGGDASVRNRLAVRQILKDSGKVALVLQGHEHQGGYQQIDGIRYYTLVASVESEDAADNTCAVVQLHPDGAVEITGYNRAVSRRLAGSPVTAAARAMQEVR
jgi:predicted phosphodiesterase